MKSTPMAAALGALVLVAACGGDETNAPDVIASPSPGPQPITTIPPRSQTTAYAPGFTPDRDRRLEGFQVTVSNTLTGATLPGGGPVIASSVSLSEKGPRSTDVEAFTGSFTFGFANRTASYVDFANNAARFAGDATGFRSADGLAEWTADSQPTADLEESLQWRRATPVNQVVPQFHSMLIYQARAAGSTSRFMFLGGSLTDANDLPPSGAESQRARLVIQSDEPGDGSYQLVGEGDLRIDYNTGAVTGTFPMQPVQGSLAQPLTLTVAGTIDRANRWVRADLSGGGTGRFAGAFFGPYGGEIAASVRFERSNGQSYYGELAARRP